MRDYGVDEETTEEKPGQRKLIKNERWWRALRSEAVKLFYI